MGWLNAVALGMQEQKGNAVAKALVGSPEGVAQSQPSLGAALVVMSVVTLLI